MQPLPDTTSFRNLLSSLKVTEDDGDLDVTPKILGSIFDNREIEEVQSVFLKANQTENCKLSALTRKITESWQGTQHPLSSRLAELALAVFTVLKVAYPDPLKLFNQMLKSTVPVDVSHFIVFPNNADVGYSPSDFSGFQWGKIQSLSLEYRCKKAHSDYYKLYSSFIKNRHCIESPIYKLDVIGFLDLSWTAPSAKAIPKLFQYILLNYYQELTELYVDRMWQDLDARQSVGAAAGFEIFDIPSVKNIPAMNYITVYLNQTSREWDGYVVPWEKGLIFNSWSGDQQILRDLETYQDGLEFPVSPILAQVAKYGIRARRASKQGELAEALLSYTIALEMLFSEKNQTGDAISRRVSVLVSQSRPTDFSASKKMILNLYSTRSNYVHKGIQPTLANLEEMVRVFEKVLGVLVKLEHRKVLHKDEELTHWIRLLDWIAHGYEADQIPNDELLLEIGLK